MTAFTHQSPGAVQCSTCWHCPSSVVGFRCRATMKHVTGKSYWRRCAAYRVDEEKKRNARQARPAPPPAIRPAPVPRQPLPAIETFTHALENFADLDQAEEYVLTEFRRFVWRQRLARRHAQHDG